MVFIIPFPGKSDPQQNQANYELRVSFLIKSQEVRYRLGFVCLFCQMSFNGFHIPSQGTGRLGKILHCLIHTQNHCGLPNTAEPCYENGAAVGRILLVDLIT